MCPTDIDVPSSWRASDRAVSHASMWRCRSSLVRSLRGGSKVPRNRPKAARLLAMAFMVAGAWVAAMSVQYCSSARSGSETPL